MAWTSPRTTQLLHQRGDVARLAHVGLVLHELSGFGGQTGAPPLALRRLGNGLARGLGAGDPATARDLVELSKTVASQPERERRRSGCHAASVARIALRSCFFPYAFPPSLELRSTSRISTRTAQSRKPLEAVSSLEGSNPSPSAFGLPEQ